MKLKVRLEVHIDDPDFDNIDLKLFNKLNNSFESLLLNKDINMAVSKASVYSIIKLDENKVTDDRAYDFF